jgi:hypothetical protein
LQRQYEPPADVAAAGGRLLQFLRGMPTQEEERLSMRVLQRVLCGDCGVGETLIIDTCPHCSGYAQPLPTTNNNTTARGGLR